MAWPFTDSTDHAEAERTYDAEPIPGLRPLHVRLYRLLYGYVGKKQHERRPVVYPHQAELAERLGVSERTVKALIADLRTPDSRTKNRAGKAVPLELGWLRINWSPTAVSRASGAPGTVGRRRCAARTATFSCST